MDILHRKADIQKAFNRIGKANGSAPPLDSGLNNFPIAYELFVANELRSAANKRYDVAKKQADEAGVIDEAETVEGAEIATFRSKYFDVTMKRASASTTLDKTMLKNVLMRELKLNEDRAQAIIDSASKPRKGAVTIGFTLKA